MMHNRFTTPIWLNDHLFHYNYWKDVPITKLDGIKNGLSRFKHPVPLVSIVIPVWNEEATILRTLSSFASMEIPFAAELIIVNNNSTDATQEILEYLNVRTVFEQKQGIAHARLAGLKEAKGFYHLCGDGDSLYPPTWVKEMVSNLKDSSISCIYGNYSFLPVENNSRFSLGLYELFAEMLFELRRFKREYLNVRGANFGFRKHQGVLVKGFEMPITRVYDNDENSKSFVVFGEDGRMGRKLSELGKLKLVRSYNARIWTSSRRLLKDGELTKAFMKRIKKESFRIIEYLFGSKKVRNTTDTLIITTKS